MNEILVHWRSDLSEPILPTGLTRYNRNAIMLHSFDDGETV